MKKKSITAVEFDKKFENDENLVPYLKADKISKPGLKARRVSVDFPEWMVKELDQAA
ncbi:type II toxin-antitoxin system BrnA family antitoxin [Pleomorphovibrio marinus]|uniref:type II toxin-antitoxin system BrnA family antitoxin n=1 Tax=Pleomorphovibrio marinus TaxID=2164132 RepID=UPI001E5F99B0|nr:CopG family transcriptional regulator [Pleomorphovibrio marinus]